MYNIAIRIQVGPNRHSGCVASMGCSSSVRQVANFEEPQTESAFSERFKLGELLGTGAFAHVLSAYDHADCTTCAVKVQVIASEKPRDFKRNKTLRRAVHSEVDIWRQVGTNEHCVQLYEVFQGPALCFMTMESCAGSLVQKLSKMPEIGEETISQVAAQMLQGIAHLHSLGIVHRDIKCDNFLCGLDDKLKLCDFGVSALLPKQGFLKAGHFGTPPYMSPEMVKKSGHDRSTDMWSLGVTLYHLMFGDFPYVPATRNGPAMKEAIRRGVPKPKFAARNNTLHGLHDRATNFVKALLHRAPSSRLLACEALEHSLVSPRAAKKQCFLEAASALPCVEAATQRTTKLDFDSMDPTVSNELTTLLQKLQPSMKRSFTASLEEDVVSSWANLPVLRAYSLEWSFTTSPTAMEDESASLSGSKHVGSFDLQARTHSGLISIPLGAVQSCDADDDGPTDVPSATRRIKSVVDYYSWL